MTTSSIAIMRAANYLGAPRVVFYPDPEGAPATASPEPVAEAHASDDIPVETSSREPLVVAKEAPAAEPEGNSAAAGDEGTAADAGATDGERKKPAKLPDWAQAQLNNMAAEKRIAEREAKRLADEIAALRNPPAAAPAATQADATAATNAAPAGGYKTEADFSAAVAAEASRREAAGRAQQETQDFRTKLDAAWSKGLEAYGDDDFNTVAANLNSVGFVPVHDPATGQVGNTELMQLVLETDDPARVLYELGSDPDKARAVMALPPAKRAIEIAKLSVTPAAKKAPSPLSNAPRPVTPIDGSARTSAEPSDNDSDEVFFAKREAQLRARNAA